MPFMFGGKDAAEIPDGYADLAFAVFARGYLLFLLIFIVVHRCRYLRGRGGPRGGVIVPGKGVGGGHHLGRSGEPSSGGGGGRIGRIQRLQRQQFGRRRRGGGGLVLVVALVPVLVVVIGVI